MSKLPLVVLAALSAAVPVGGQAVRSRAAAGRRADRAPLVLLDSTREGDGLKGPVRRVETEVARVEWRRGELLTKPPALLERTLYDERGRRVENETYPVGGASAGQETHRYDAQGNLAETVVRDPRGAVLSRTVYQYELDRFGNWIKMTASVAVSNSGRVEYEPVEITRRSITYYSVDEPGERSAPTGGGGEGRAGVARAEAVSAGGRRAQATPEANGRQSPAATPADADGAVDAGLLNGRATWMPQPAYLVGWKRLDEPVVVTVEVVVDVTGRVVSAHARGGTQRLRDSAERAARLATFLPVYVSGRAVRSKGVVNYTFNYLP